MQQTLSSVLFPGYRRRVLGLLLLRPDEPDLLSFQNRGGTIPPYQARQLIRMMDKYGDEDDEVSD